MGPTGERVKSGSRCSVDRIGKCLPVSGREFRTRMFPTLMLMVTAVAITTTSAKTTASKEDWRPCTELNPELRGPCTCRVEVQNSSDDLVVHMNCRGAAIEDCGPPIPRHAPLASYSHTDAGLRALPVNIFSDGLLPLPLLSVVDLSRNSMRRLIPGGRIHSMRDTLSELRLADNLLGDADLNPIFSSMELHGLGALRVLDLSGNGIRAIDSGILRGCVELRVLLLNRNRLSSVPIGALNGPRAITHLSLSANVIETLATGELAGSEVLRDLEELNLDANGMKTLEGGAFVGLHKLRRLDLSANRFTRFNSDVFEGAAALVDLRLADNFLTELPTVALAPLFAHLNRLDLTANSIGALPIDGVPHMGMLRRLDLARNALTTITKGAFAGVPELRWLDLSINPLRTIEGGALDGLRWLNDLLLRDVNILAVPATTIGRLSRLTRLRLDYNRVAAVSDEIVRSVPTTLVELGLTNNFIRELPPGTFRRLTGLQRLELAGNQLSEPPAGLPTDLRYLDLANNMIVSAPLAGTLPRSLTHLNISGNPHGLNLLEIPSALVMFDAGRSSASHLPPDLLSDATNLQVVRLPGNLLSRLEQSSFVRLPRLRHVDLSNNRLTALEARAFVGTARLRELRLGGNKLQAFGGELFDTGTDLRELDLSDNRIERLSPTSFKIHPRLETLLLARNRLASFDGVDLLSGMQYLRHLDLSHNRLVVLEPLGWNLPALAELLLGTNRLESLGGAGAAPFRNTSQLSRLDLSRNRLRTLDERTFDGVVRLSRVDLSNNELDELPDSIFDRTRLGSLEHLLLAGNRFATAPLRVLLPQLVAAGGGLVSVDLSHNRLKELPQREIDDPASAVLLSVEDLDLSFNPLTKATLIGLLSEPKIVRRLNLVGCGLNDDALRLRLETPFLRHLNLSFNGLTESGPSFSGLFERTSLLETLDLSHNIMSVAPVLQSLSRLERLHLNNNPLQKLTGRDLEQVGTGLRHLDISRLDECFRLEKEVFAGMTRLRGLSAHGYPRLGYLDAGGLLQNLPTSLEHLDVEIKDAAFGGGDTAELLGRLRRLRSVGLHGASLTSVRAGTLSGLGRNPDLTLRLRNTSLTAIPAALLFSVPRSTNIILDVSGSRLTGLPAQLLYGLEHERRHLVHIVGLDSNPLACDCGAAPLAVLERNDVPTPWSPVRLTCSSPPELAGTPLSIAKLTCGRASPTTMSTTTAKGKLPLLEHEQLTMRWRQAQQATARHRVPSAMDSTTESDIIWSLATATAVAAAGPAGPRHMMARAGPAIGGAVIASHNDDTLIISIVGGVVLFIAVLVVAVCVARMRDWRHGGATPPLSSLPARRT